MRHITTWALFLVWVGATSDREPRLPWDDFPLGLAACVAVKYPHNSIAGRGGLKEIPTCPRCAVLYDEAMTAREEFLGKQAA